MQPGSKRSLPNCHSPAMRISTLARRAHSGIAAFTSAHIWSATARSAWRTSHVSCAYSDRMPALLGQATMRATVALPSVAWYFQPTSLTATASMAAPTSALRRRSIGVGPACAVSPWTSTCMPRVA